MTDSVRGLQTGDLNTDDLLCRLVAEHAPSIVVNVDYRLSPEHKVPTQLQDTLTVYKWVSEGARRRMLTGRILT